MDYSQKTGNMEIGQVSFHNDKKVGKLPTIVGDAVVTHGDNR